MNGEELGLLIGKHGATIDALQHVAMRAALRGDAERKQVVVDAAGYRERRATALHRAADRAVSGRVAVRPAGRPRADAAAGAQGRAHVPARSHRRRDPQRGRRARQAARRHAACGPRRRVSRGVSRETVAALAASHGLGSGSADSLGGASDRAQRRGGPADHGERAGGSPGPAPRRQPQRARDGAPRRRIGDRRRGSRGRLPRTRARRGPARSRRGSDRGHRPQVRRDPSAWAPRPGWPTSAPWQREQRSGPRARAPAPTTPSPHERLRPLAVLVEYAAPLLRESGTLVAWKGRRDEEEESAAATAADVVGLEAVEVRRVIPFAGARDRHLHVFRKVGPTPARFPSPCRHGPQTPSRLSWRTRKESLVRGRTSGGRRIPTAPASTLRHRWARSSR